MKQKMIGTKQRLVNAGAIFYILLLLACNFTSCTTNKDNTVLLAIEKQQSLIIVADDKSISTSLFSRPDTSLIRKLCEAVCCTGGTLLFYKIGNPSDQSGYRCTLQPVPDINTEQTMERQIQEKQKLEEISHQNYKAIETLLIDVQKFIFNDSLRDANTDLNGFLGKVDIVLNEPQYKTYKRFVFIVSDGVQSISGHDSPTAYNFKSTDFNLCLCGWKASLPDTMSVMQFESPKGFTEYINCALNSKK